MPLIAISIFFQLLFVIHVVKTGRNTTWIWIIVMLPAAGALAYLIVEVLPDITHSRAGRSASRKVQSTLNPNKDMKAAIHQYSLSDTVENSMRLAEECFVKGLHSEARELYKKCLNGPHKDDPDLMFGLAKTEFELGNSEETQRILDELIELNPEYKNPNAHLLYARSLESLNKISEALHEYETLHGYYTGPDASYYFACFLKQQKQHAKAKDIFNQILQSAKNSGKHYNSIHKETLRKTRLELNNAPSTVD